MAMVLRVQEEIINIRKMMVFINLKRSRFGVCFCDRGKTPRVLNNAKQIIDLK